MHSGPSRWALNFNDATMLERCVYQNLNPLVAKSFGSDQDDAECGNVTEQKRAVSRSCAKVELDNAWSA